MQAAIIFFIEPRCRSPPKSIQISQPTQKFEWRTLTMSVKINLKDFYPWYTHDEFVEVPDVIAAELTADRRYEKSHKQRIRRNKSYYSLDVDDGIEASTMFNSSYDPEVALEIKERYCRICIALNSLPTIQGRRITAHYIHCKSQAEIAEIEGVSKGSVSISITRGLTALKIILRSLENQSNSCP